MSLLATVADDGGEKTDNGRLLPEPPAEELIIAYGYGGGVISLLATVADGEYRRDDGLTGGFEDDHG